MTDLSFERDIRPLFRQKDINAMKSFGGFDLSSHSDVSEYADLILERLEAGTMPCDGAWPNEDVSKFQQWVAGGKKI
jgi:hypothetical protein